MNLEPVLAGAEVDRASPSEHLFQGRDISKSEVVITQYKETPITACQSVQGRVDPAQALGTIYQVTRDCYQIGRQCVCLINNLFKISPWEFSLEMQIGKMCDGQAVQGSRQARQTQLFYDYFEMGELISRDTHEPGRFFREQRRLFCGVGQIDIAGLHHGLPAAVWCGRSLNEPVAEDVNGCHLINEE